MRHRYRRDRISGLSISPVRHRVGLYYRFHRQSIDGLGVCDFLRHLRGPVTVIRDNASIHRGDPVREMCRRFARLHLVPLPAYAPELNPDEGVWNLAKASLANGRPDHVEELDIHLDETLERIRGAPSQRRVFNANSYVGGILTTRVGSEGRRNIVYGTDAIFRIVGNDYLILNWAQSFDDQDPPALAVAVAPLDGSVIRLNWQRRGADGLTYSLDVARTEELFDPGMGFLRRSDITKGQVDLGYGWRPGLGARLFTYALQFDGAVFRRNGDGSIESAEIWSTVILETWGRHVLNLSVPFRYENLESSFSLPAGSSVPAGIYRFAGARLQYRSPQGARLQTNAVLEGGKLFDGRRASLTFGPVWDPSARLNLSVNYRVDHVNFPDATKALPQVSHDSGRR